ncbi:hypothetical protein KKH27_00595 [bacterium]|nr:hypothetical protein [bacterium]MBU1984624.1 hypothetical protein [bacterium]
MKYLRIALIFVLLLTAPLSTAWTLLTPNDRGSVHHYGAVMFTRRNPGTYSGNHHASRETSWGDSSRWIVHATRPDSNIETIMIGPLTLGEFIPGCSDEDTVKFHFELVAAFNDSLIDSLRDFTSEPLAVSPTLFIPYEGVGPYYGYTERYFFSSMTRLQSNGWDDFVPSINEHIQLNRAFIIRMVPEPGSGVILRDWNDFYAGPILSFSLDLDAEEEWLDIGDSRIVYLSPSDAAGFHGVLLRGDWQREWGQSARLRLSGFRNDSLRSWREISVPFQELQLTGNFIVGIRPEYLQQFPYMTWVANRYPGNPQTIPWRCDTLTAYWQP